MSEKLQPYMSDYNSLPPEEKQAWTYEHYQLTRRAIDKYFVSYGLDVAMIIGMMDRARETDIRYVTMIKVIEDKLLPEYSRDLNELETIFAFLFDIVLRPFPDKKQSWLSRTISIIKKTLMIKNA